MSERVYPLAPQGVFATIQGEGPLAGLPQVFVRLAGCSIGCPGCDTDYSAKGRRTASAIAEEASRLAKENPSTDWCWLTGGEPTDHPLAELVAALRGTGLSVAMVTGGTREVARGRQRMGGVDLLHVSPHNPATWVQRAGDVLNLVPFLGRIDLSDRLLADMVDGCERDFAHRYVTPMALPDGRPDGESLAACLKWVRRRRGWRLGVQAHRHWRLP